MIWLEAVLVQRIELIGPEENWLEYRDLLTNDRDQIPRLDIELLQRVAVPLVYPLHRSHYRLAAGVGYQTVYRQPALTFRAHHVIDRAEGIGSQYPRDAVGQFHTALC